MQMNRNQGELFLALRADIMNIQSHSRTIGNCTWSISQRACTSRKTCDFWWFLKPRDPHSFAPRWHWSLPGQEHQTTRIEKERPKNIKKPVLWRLVSCLRSQTRVGNMWNRGSFRTEWGKMSLSYKGNFRVLQLQLRLWPLSGAALHKAQGKGSGTWGLAWIWSFQGSFARDVWIILDSWIRAR